MDQFITLMGGLKRDLLVMQVSQGLFVDSFILPLGLIVSGLLNYFSAAEKKYLVGYAASGGDDIPVQLASLMEQVEKLTGQYTLLIFPDKCISRRICFPCIGLSFSWSVHLFLLTCNYALVHRTRTFFFAEGKKVKEK